MKGCGRRESEGEEQQKEIGKTGVGRKWREAEMEGGRGRKEAYTREQKNPLTNPLLQVSQYATRCPDHNIRLFQQDGSKASRKPQCARQTSQTQRPVPLRDNFCNVANIQHFDGSRTVR